MDTFRFLKFKVYKDSISFYKKILLISSNINKLSLRDQIKRAALSIILNIAEGSAKKSDADFARFLEISIGSLNEVVACLNVLEELKSINETEIHSAYNESEELAKQLGGFIKRLRS